ncbi:MAG TPA: hypothetical protein VH475_06685 [Tepidisphaeraceae bacterium]
MRLKRVIRVVLWGVKGVLLAVCLGVLVLAARSTRRAERAFVETLRPAGAAEVYTRRGAESAWFGLSFSFDRSRIDSPKDPAVSDSEPTRMRRMVGAWMIISESADLSRPTSVPIYSRLGFAYSEYRRDWGRGPGYGWSCVVPFWFAALVTGTWPVSSLFLTVRRRLRARRRHLVGHCPTCGYDLRATPDRCPECGTAPAAKTSA